MKTSKKKIRRSDFKCWSCKKELAVAMGLCKKCYSMKWRKDSDRGHLRERNKKFKEQQLEIAQDILEWYKGLIKKKKKIIMIYGAWGIQLIIRDLIKKKKIKAINCFVSAKAPKDYWDFIIE